MDEKVRFGCYNSDVENNFFGGSMEITWYGHSCFRITERGMATVVTDPYDVEAVGYSPLNLKADIVTVSHDQPGHNYIKAVKGSSWQITGPGEYEIGGVFLTGLFTGGKKGLGVEKKNCAFVFDYDGVNVLHLGAMKDVPTKAEIEAFGTVDVALVPVGGGSGLSAAKAAETISMIEPGIVIPMHYQLDVSKTDIAPLEKFLKEMGMSKDYTAEPSLKIKNSGIPEETQVVILEPVLK